MAPLPDRNCQYLSTSEFDLIGDLSFTCSCAHGDFMGRKSGSPRIPRHVECLLRLCHVTRHNILVQRNRRPKSASTSLFHPMPALLCLPGERTPCEREEMRCKGQRVPIRATPLSPICAQFMPLRCCGVHRSPAAATGCRKKAIFQSAPVPFLSLSVPPFLWLNKIPIRLCN